MKEKEIIELINSTITERAIIIGYRYGLSQVLGGEPRYSVKELEKIWYSVNDLKATSEVSEFFQWVKSNPKKIKEILEEKK